MKLQISTLLLLATLALSSYSYDKIEAFKFFEYSKITYCPSQTIRDWSCKSCQTKSGIDRNRVVVVQGYEFQSQGYVAYDQKENLIVVAFRGTSNMRNWMSNFNSCKIRYDHCKGCKVHKGFYNVWDSMKFEVLVQVQKLKRQHKDAKVLVTGHSLGGAIAMIATMDILKLTDIKADHFISFGQPRVGDEDFVSHFNIMFPKAVRVVNWRDPVPQVPLTIMGYRHGDQEIWYNDPEDYSQYKECSVIEGEDDSCSKSVISACVEDHLKYFGVFTGCGSSPDDQVAQDHLLQMSTINETLQ